MHTVRHPAPTSAAALAGEAVILAGAGAAILLQVAHRPVGAGVAVYSRFTEDPMRRLRHTLAYIYAVTLPEAAPAREAVVARVRAAHRPVQGIDDGGHPYAAADPDAQLWVAATLYWAGEQVRRRVWGALDAEDADHLYRGFAPLATSLEVPASAWPADRTAFAVYWDERVARLEVTDDARRVAADLFSGYGVPAPLRAAMPLARFVTAGLLPGRVRAGLGWSWSGRDSVREARLWGLARAVYRPLPVTVRGVVVGWALRGRPRMPEPRGAVVAEATRRDVRPIWENGADV